MRNFDLWNYVGRKVYTPRNKYAPTAFVLCVFMRRTILVRVIDEPREHR